MTDEERAQLWLEVADWVEWVNEHFAGSGADIPDALRDRAAEILNGGLENFYKAPAAAELRRWSEERKKTSREVMEGWKRKP